MAVYRAHSGTSSGGASGKKDWSTAHKLTPSKAQPAEVHYLRMVRRDMPVRLPMPGPYAEALRNALLVRRQAERAVLGMDDLIDEVPPLPDVVLFGLAFAGGVIVAGAYFAVGRGAQGEAARRSSPEGMHAADA